MRGGGVFADEEGEERGALGGGGFAVGAVTQVGVGASHLLAVLVPEREPPELLAGGVGGDVEAAVELVVVDEQPGGGVAQAVTTPPVRVARSMTAAGL